MVMRQQCSESTTRTCAEADGGHEGEGARGVAKSHVRHAGAGDERGGGGQEDEKEEERHGGYGGDGGEGGDGGGRINARVVGGGCLKETF